MSFQIGRVISNGKILQWDGNSIAINKINSVDLSFKKRTFPFWAVLIIVVGFLLFTTSWLFSLILMAVGGVWIYWWYEHQQYDYHINLRTSSTEPFILYFGTDVNLGNEVKNAILNEIANL